MPVTYTESRGSLRRECHAVAERYTALVCKTGAHSQWLNQGLGSRSGTPLSPTPPGVVISLGVAPSWTIISEFVRQLIGEGIWQIELRK